jgi:hypothetical protein
MSFGWSAGDIAAAVQFAFKIADALRESGGSVDQRNKAQALHQTYQLALNLVEECHTQDANGNPIPIDPKLAPILQTMKDLDVKLQKRLSKSEGMVKRDGENFWAVFVRLGHKLAWPFFQDPKVQDIRSQIIGQIQILQTILML